MGHGHRKRLTSSDFAFTGHYFDRATGLTPTLYHAYDPSISRWLSTDPVGLQGGNNLYAYVGNDPTNFTDTFGQCPALALLFTLAEVGLEFAIAATAGGSAAALVLLVVCAEEELVQRLLPDPSLHRLEAPCAGLRAMTPTTYGTGHRVRRTGPPIYRAGRRANIQIPGVSADSFADRMLKEQYGDQATYPKGPGSEHSKIKKSANGHNNWGDMSQKVFVMWHSYDRPGDDEGENRVEGFATVDGDEP